MDNYTGKKIWNVNQTKYGIVHKHSMRRAVNLGNIMCLIVKWDDGTITKPGLGNIRHLPNGDLKIM